jgi:hypothetical protein
MLSEKFAIVSSHSAAADRYNTNPVGDYLNAGKFEGVSFLLSQATAGTNTGTAVVTVQAASSDAGASAEAIPFRYRKKTTGASAVWGSVIEAAASGFTTTANEDTIYEIEVKGDGLPEGKPFVAVKLTEGVNDPVTACVIAIGTGVRYQGQTQPDALS